ncbi:MAG: carboxypeptidase regulatory-like domain-containing protein, partial [Acidobacteria bacterium]|nr:carboxypeptidase regulatory-like domain-containing protein [Acidobacteriota bacterium]
MKPIARILFVVVFLASLGVNLSWAQTFTGTFVGTVNDSTGAVLPGAKLTVTNLDTALERTATSDSTGGYVVPLLPAGEYKITVEISGFKRALRERVSLQVNQELRVDFTLSPGEVIEEVLVTEALPLVQTETATVGTVVAQREVLELPLNGRNFLQLNLLVPGAVPGAKGSQLGTQGGSINVHGLRESSNFFWLDGIDNTTMAIGQLVVNPPTYSVQEFKVQSPTYSAEFGRTAGAQINIITRSGKNTFHGDAYEFLRNDVLDAKNFFDPAGKIPKFRRNQFGVDVGGPIVRDRTFFFGGYEALREHRARTFTGVVPLSAMVTGDFSSLNPNPTSCTDPGAICDPSTGSPFAGNVIPSSRIDSIGGTLAAAYPAPNNPDPLRNLAVNPVFVLYDHSVIGKVDHQLTKNDHLFGRYNFQNIHEVQPVNLFVRTTNIPGYGRQQPKTRFQTFGVSDTHTFSPRVIGEFRFGWNRWKLDYLHQDQGDDIAQRLGIQGLSTQPIDLGFPLINMGGAFENLGSADNLPQHGPFDTYHWAGT